MSARWINYGISAPDEAAAKAAAAGVLAYDPSFELLDEAGGWSTGSYRHALDPIGAVYEDDGVYDAETGAVVTAPTRRPGWYANLLVRPDIAADVSQLLALVGAPHGVTIVEDTGRVWA